MSGNIDGHEIAVGGWDFISERIDETAFSRDIREWIRRDGVVSVLAAMDGVLAGAFLLADEVRPEVGHVLRQNVGLGEDELQLISPPHLQGRARFGAHTDPIDARRHGLRAVRFHRNFKAIGLAGPRQALIELQQGLDRLLAAARTSESEPGTRATVTASVPSTVPVGGRARQ